MGEKKHMDGASVRASMACLHSIPLLLLVCHVAPALN